MNISNVVKGLLIGFIFFASHASAVTCKNLLDPSRQAKIFLRIEKLNPKLIENYLGKDLGVQDLSHLYLELKTEAWKYQPRGMLPFKNRPLLSEELKTNLRTQFAKHYKVESMNEDGLYLFYANSLWSLYVFVFQSWAAEVVETYLPVNSPFEKELKGFGNALLTKSLLQMDFQSPRLEPVLAADEFNKKEWEKFPWDKAIQIATEWFTHKTINTSSLNSREQYLVEDALKRPGFEDVCCLSEPACVFCPNNRGVLNKP